MGCMKPEDFCSTCLGFFACNKPTLEATCFLCRKDFCCISEKKKETCDCFGANGVASFCEKCASSPKLTRCKIHGSIIACPACDNYADAECFACQWENPVWQRAHWNDIVL